MSGDYTQDKAYRRWRTSLLIMPIKVRVRQSDGSTCIQWVDASVKRDERRDERRRDERKEAP